MTNYWTTLHCVSTNWKRGPPSHKLYDYSASYLLSVIQSTRFRFSVAQTLWKWLPPLGIRILSSAIIGVTLSWIVLCPSIVLSGDQNIPPCPTHWFWNSVHKAFLNQGVAPFFFSCICIGTTHHSVFISRNKCTKVEKVLFFFSVSSRLH